MKRGSDLERKGNVKRKGDLKRVSDLKGESDLRKVIEDWVPNLDQESKQRRGE